MTTDRKHPPRPDRHRESVREWLLSNIEPLVGCLVIGLFGFLICYFLLTNTVVSSWLKRYFDEKANYYNLTRVCAVLEEYRSKKGQYPESIVPLIQERFSGRTRDEMLGKYHYKSDGENYILYFFSRTREGDIWLRDTARMEEHYFPQTVLDDLQRQEGKR